MLFKTYIAGLIMNSKASGTIITFYSYKGGAGRSMALANLAWLLASNDKKVLVIDWDLEAPGVHRYFQPFLIDPELESSEGLIDFLWDLVMTAMTPLSGSAKSANNLEAWITEAIDITQFAIMLDRKFERNGSLAIIPAGQQGATYSEKVNLFDWENFYTRLGGWRLIEAVRQHLKQEYDYVLVDSRTGVADTSAICTVQMPDRLVACTLLNNQSLTGISDVLKSISAQRKNNKLKIFPVIMRVDLSEQQKLEAARSKARQMLEPYLDPEIDRKDITAYWNDAEVLYYPYYAYEEVLATFGDQAGPQLSDKSLLGSMVRLTQRITDLTITIPDISEEVRQDVLARYVDGGGYVDSEKPHKFQFKPTFPRVRLPENFVKRSVALNAVKEMLLAEDDRSAAVSVISGMGGLGKSVLARALVLDEEVQARFADGVLWVALGQNPDLHDLQRLLIEWIEELGTPRQSFLVMTVNSASQYLDRLLAEKRMLLVVDDVWNAAHLDWFRVGGAGCRVLATTREAQIEGAAYYSLKSMTEEEAIALVRQKMQDRWSEEQVNEVKEVVRVLGYLPLALDLAVSQVLDGLSWEDLRSEFAAEHGAVAFEVLDSSEEFKYLPLDKRRLYSLQVCFNLSLSRLEEKKPKLLQQFVWLGVLGEGVIDAQVAQVLWNERPVMAKKALLDLQQRSFLTERVATSSGEPTYRVHDLMHDMARNLIVDGFLKGLSSESTNKILDLSSAHGEFLNRYRERAVNGCWDGLPNDGYIHRHLTWHMEQANWINEIHDLIEMSNDQGRNAWFEACDRIKQPSIFEEDVARGWELAEQDFILERKNEISERENEESIVRQCRYALITSTLNSLAENLPIGVVEEFVKRDFWTIEQAWAYVEQMHDENKLASTIQVLAPYLQSKSLFHNVLAAAGSIQDEFSRADVLSELAKVDGADFSGLLKAARSIQDEFSRADVLSELAKIETADFPELLEEATKIQYESRRAEVLCELAKIDAAYFPQALKAADDIQVESSRAYALSELAKINAAYFPQALKAVEVILNEYVRADVLRELAKIETADFPELLEEAMKIQYESIRAEVLCELAKTETADFSMLLAAARDIQDEFSRASVLRELAKTETADFPELLEEATKIQYESRRAEVLCELAKIDAAYFPQALKAADDIQVESSRAYALSELAKINAAYFPQALKAVEVILDEYVRADVLSELAKTETADFPELLEQARDIQDESRRAGVLRELAKIETADFPELFEEVTKIQDESRRAGVLRELAKIETADFSALLQEAKDIQDESRRTFVLRELAKIDADYFSEALEAARTIQDESRRANALRELAKTETADFSALLAAAKDIQDKSSWDDVLSELAKTESADFSALLQEAKDIQDEPSRAYALKNLAKRDETYFSEKVKAVDAAIKNESRRPGVLIKLAKIDSADYFSKALEAAAAIQDGYIQANALRELAKTESADFSALLAAARDIQDQSIRAEVLRELAKTESADFSALLVAARDIQDQSIRAEVLRELAKIDGNYLTEALEAAQAIQDQYRRANALRELDKIQNADFPSLKAASDIQDGYIRAEVLRKLAKTESADFSTLLAAARDIQYESNRVGVLSELAKIESADFSALLAAAGDIQDESRRAGVLSELAKTESADFSALLAAAGDIQDESIRAEVLCELTQHASQKNFLVNLWKAIFNLNYKPAAAKALSQILPYFQSPSLSYVEWKPSLHLLASRKRADLMQDLVNLYTTILNLGGKTAMSEIVKGIFEVCNQWQ